MWMTRWLIRRRSPEPRCTRPGPARTRRPAAAASLPPELPEPGSTCGWFDSSWELRQGLKVIEHTDFERLPPEVPLAWLLP